MRGPRLRIEGGALGSLRVVGELDRSNAPVLLEAVRLAARRVRPGAVLELDCTGLAFLDASAAETIVRAANELAPARELIVVEPGTVIGRLLRLLARTSPSLVVVSANDGAALPRAS